MQAGEAGVAALLIAVGFSLGWGATGAMLPEPQPEPPGAQLAREAEVPVEARPAVRAVPQTVERRDLVPGAVDARPTLKRRVLPIIPPQPQPTAAEQPPPQERPAPPDPLAAAARELAALRANVKSVAQFERAYAEIKSAAQVLPADQRGRVLSAINAANLTGDVEALARGLELLRKGLSDAPP